jgi:uncharacterized protein (TIGR02391 family)
MARRTPPPTPTPAQLTPLVMQAALPKLNRRIEDLRALDPDAVQQRSDPRFRAVADKIEDTLVEIFGIDTIEYRRYRVGSLDTAPMTMGRSASIHEVRAGYKRGIERAIGTLQTIVEVFEEKLGDVGGSPELQAVRSFGALDLHPEIKRAVAQLFYDGHYSNAIEDACKVLDALVKMRSGKFELSGTDLMLTVFSAKNPILRFSDLASESDRSEQQGLMHLYAGSMLAFRNPRAHELVKDDAECALEVISFISFLAKTLDRAEK